MSRRRRRTRIKTNNLGMILWLKTVQRMRTKPLCPVVIRTTVYKIWTRTTVATNRREGNVKDYEVLDDKDLDIMAEA